MREEIRINMNFAIPRRYLTLMLAAAVVAIVTPELGSENVTLSTYYPAPSGVYNKMITTGATLLATSGGSVGIGTTTPDAKLQVVTGAGMGLHITAPGGFGNEPYRAQANSTFFASVNGAGTQRFAINNDGEGATPLLNFYGSDAGWFNFMSVNNNGLREVSFPAGHVAIGGTATGGTSQGGYLYLKPGDCRLAYAYSVAGFTTNICSNAAYCPSMNCYATFTSGVYVDGWSVQGHGGQVQATRYLGVQSGTLTTQVATLTPGGSGATCVANEWCWGTLTPPSPGSYFYCCPK